MGGTKERIDMMVAVIDSREDMVHYIEKLFPILDKLMDTISTFDKQMKGESGILSVIKNARDMTQDEINKSKDQDQSQTLANKKLLKNKKKVAKWLLDNEKKINN